MYHGQKRVGWPQVSLAAIVCSTILSAGAWAEPSTAESGEVYGPVQSISRVLGSKLASGYFRSVPGECMVVFMVAEAQEPGVEPALSAVRVRLSMRPGQVFNLDSEEGNSLAVTCGEDAGTVIVRDAVWSAEDLALTQ